MACGWVGTFPPSPQAALFVFLLCYHYSSWNELAVGVLLNAHCRRMQWNLQPGLRDSYQSQMFGAKRASLRRYQLFQWEVQTMPYALWSCKIRSKSYLVQHSPSPSFCLCPFKQSNVGLLPAAVFPLGRSRKGSLSLFPIGSLYSNPLNHIIGHPLLPLPFPTVSRRTFPFLFLDYPWDKSNQKSIQIDLAKFKELDAYAQKVCCLLLWYMQQGIC